MSSEADSFKALLTRLAEAHDRELQAGLKELREENTRLQFSLRVQRMSTDHLHSVESDASDIPIFCVENPENPDGHSSFQTNSRTLSKFVEPPSDSQRKAISAFEVPSPMSVQPSAALLPSLPSHEEGDSEQADPLRTPSGLRTDAKLSVHVEMRASKSEPKEVAASLSEQEFLLRSLWTVEVAPPRLSLRTSRAKTWTFDSVGSSQEGDVSERMKAVANLTEVKHSRGCHGKFIHYPGHPARIAWDLVGALWIMYDSIVIPLQVFEPPETTFGMILDLVILIYWTLNMPASLMVGYVRKGMTEMRPRMILLNYLSTWFPIDVVVVIPDWFFTIKSLRANAGDNQAGESISLLRLVRLIRTVRLIRLLKLRWILIMINDLLSSEYASIIANIAKMIMVLVVINHFLACIFFMLARLQLNKRPTWITEYGFADASWGYQYLTAFHFSITQFTPASMHVQPENSVERAFTIFVVVFALVAFSYLVGSITNSMTQLRSMTEDASKQFWVLRRYLKQQQVPRALGMRIQRYIEHAWARQKASVAEPKLFSLLSEQLSQELKCTRSLPHLQVHPLFGCLHKHSYISMQRLAVDAINWRNLAQDDILFFPNETATHLYFVVEGKLLYSKVDPLGLESTEEVDRAEDWVAEPVLWTPTWIHLGTLTAISEAALVLIDGATFGDIIGRSPSMFQLVSRYARRFMQWVNSRPLHKLSDISQGEHISQRLQGYIDEAFLHQPGFDSSLQHVLGPSTVSKQRSYTAFRSMSGCSGGSSSSGTSLSSSCCHAKEV